MKPFIQISAALALAAIATAFTACSSEEFGDSASADSADGSVMTFTCQAPALQTATTRAYSDGQKADNLYYAVYALSGDDNSTPTLVETNWPGTALSANKPYTFNNEARPKASVNIRVAIGQTYTVLFLGMPDGAPYTFNPRQGTMTVDYEGATCNDELRDAFYAAETFTATKSSLPREVTLHRPFAQVNVGTAWADWQLAAKHSHTPQQSTFSVEGAYSTLNMFNGEVSDEVTATFALADLPDGSETFPKLNAEGTSDYAYLSMNYVLVNEAKKDFTCTFATDNFDAGSTWTIENVPMQRNHRTNIFGDAMLTVATKVNVEIDPEYDLDDYNFGPYEQLQAIAAKGEGTLNLAGDIVLEHHLTCQGSGDQVMTINLLGHTIKMNNEDYDIDPLIINGGTVVLNGPGEIDAGDGRDHTIARVYGDGTLIVNGGTYYNGVYAGTLHQSLFDQVSKTATVILNDGIFSTPMNPAECGWIFAYPKGYNNCHAYGGYYLNYDPRIGVDHQHSGTASLYEYGNFVPDGYNVIKTTDNAGLTWYKVEKP